MSKRMELVPFKWAGVEKQADGSTDLVVFNRDAGRKVTKPLYYVFDKADLEKFAPATAAPGTVFKLVCQSLQVAYSLAQIRDPAAGPPTGTPTATYTRVRIEEVQA